MTIIDRIDCAATRAQLIAMAAVQEGARALRPRTTAEPTEGYCFRPRVHWRR